MLLTYTIEIETSDKDKLPSFSKQIQEIYDSKKGLKILYNNKLKFKRVKLGNPANFHIKLVSNDRIKRHCGFDLLSCADMGINTIFLNCERWWNASETFIRGLRSKDKKNYLKLYQIYVVNHETGHILGFDHPTPSYTLKSDEPCSFIAQQTINTHGGYSNPWPMITDKKYNKYKRL